MRRIATLLALVLVVVGVMPVAVGAAEGDITEVEVDLFDPTGDEYAADGDESAYPWVLWCGTEDDLRETLLQGMNANFGDPEIDMGTPVFRGTTGGGFTTVVEGSTCTDESDTPTVDQPVYIAIDWDDEMGSSVWDAEDHQLTFFYGTLADGDGDGKVKFELQTAIDKSDTNDGGEFDYEANVDNQIWVLEDGILRHVSSDGNDNSETVDTGAGTFTVLVAMAPGDDEDEGEGFKDGIEASYDYDQGELMYWDDSATAAGASELVVEPGIERTGLYFDFRNEPGLDPLVFDHAEAGPFTDMVGNFAEASAAALLQLGVTEGCADGLFCPNDAITRAEVVVMICRWADGYAFPCPDDSFPVGYPGYFADVPASYWAFAEIDAWYDEGYISGKVEPDLDWDDPDHVPGVFGPDDSITRAELVTILFEGFGSTEALVMDFTDVTGSHWAADAINWAVYEGLVSGYDDDTFRPDNAITRAEAAVIIANFHVWRTAVE